ncbi:MAG: F0F1 ATP synthase subunit B [Phycisphaerae bacterium]|nr:F0F1 ATP synthase subunit B [Phycisphaerae bacterium]
MRKAVLLALLLTLLLCPLAISFESSVDDGFHSSEAEDEGKINVFSGYPGESIWTIVSFVVLVAVLWKLAWKPMLAGLHAREEFIAKQLSDAEGTRKKAEEVLADYHEKLSDADREGKGIIARHTKTAEKESKEIADLTKKELDELRARLKAEIEYERKEAQSEFWDQAGDIVLELGKEVLGKSMDHADHDKLIDEAIVRLKEEEATQAKLKQE